MIIIVVVIVVRAACVRPIHKTDIISERATAPPAGRYAQTDGARHRDPSISDATTTTTTMTTSAAAAKGFLFDGITIITVAVYDFFFFSVVVKSGRARGRSRVLPDNDFFEYCRRLSTGKAATAVNGRRP